MTWEELEQVLRVKRHSDELSELRAEVSKDVGGVRGSRQRVLEEATRMELASLVTKYVAGEAVQGATEKHALAKRVAATLLADVKRDTSKRLERIVVPSQDSLLPPRGSGRQDITSALMKLENILQEDGGIVRIVSDRDSVTVIYREVGVTADSLGNAIADLIGKIERVGR